MRCTRVEELLPLFVEDDLDREDASAVFDHLRSCAGCAELAEALRESQQVLRLGATPELDDAFFDEVRRRVLDEIADAAARTATGRVALWRAVGFAAAAALVLATGLALYAGSAGGPELVGPVSTLTPVPVADTTGTPDDRVDPDETTEVAAPKGPQPAGTVRRHRPRPRGDRPAGSALEARTKSRGDRASAPAETIRIEYQTSDPTIRIIWFSQKPGDATSPRQTTQGV